MKNKSTSIIDTQPARPTGRLVIDVFLRGELVERFDECNLVVDGYKQTHAHLVGGDVTGQSVTKFAVGTNGSAPVSGNSAITSSFSKSVDSVSYPASNQVQFSFSLGSGEANGKSILEFGLLTANDVLYARRVRSIALAKTSDMSFSGTWTITF